MSQLCHLFGDTSSDTPQPQRQMTGLLVTFFNIKYNTSSDSKIGNGKLTIELIYQLDVNRLDTMR